MKQYHNCLKTILEQGEDKPDRTGVGIKSIFGYQMRFDLQKGFPLVTTKKIHIKSIVHELLWFLRGETNITMLKEHGVSIWDEWADEQGDLGPIYGKQWRAWRDYDNDKIIDQIEEVISTIKTDPNSRRLIVSAWNVADLPKMALYPCHVLFQFYVVNNRLSCQLYQRSVDSFLGMPFNIASYALLMHIIAQQCNLSVGDFIWTGGDCHIYHNHLSQVELLLSREPFPLPKLVIKNKPSSISDYQFSDFEFQNYQYHPAISAPVAV